MRWQARFVPDAMPAGVCQFGVVDLDKGHEVCRAWKDGDTALIAAAPEMLEALEAVRAHVTVGTRRALPETFRKVDRALAKARTGY